MPFYRLQYSINDKNYYFDNDRIDPKKNLFESKAEVLKWFTETLFAENLTEADIYDDNYIPWGYNEYYDKYDPSPYGIKIIEVDFYYK